jgi:hypothetical protein
MSSATVEFQKENVKDIAYAILQEMEVISSLCHNEGNGLISPVFYINTYKRLLTKSYPGILFRESDAKGLVLYRTMHDATMRMFMDNKDVHIVDSKFRVEKGRKAIMLTHIPYDLLSYTEFDKLHLLESHTGVIKTRKDWWSKYYPIGTKDMSHFPFLERLMLVFGDKYLIRAQLIKVRNEIYVMSLERGWHVLTTDAKVKMDIGLMKDHYLRKFLLAIC